jgi:AcrR family transcriptional regulator
MPRARLRSDQSDDDLLAQVAHVLSRVGPADLTLRRISEEVGCVPATLSQRFGSKEDLLRALAIRNISRVRRRLANVRFRCRSSLQALYELWITPEPRTVAHHVAFVLTQVQDPHVRAFALGEFSLFERDLQAMLRSAADKGELTDEVVPRIDDLSLGRAVVRAFLGTVLHWSLHQNDTLQSQLNGDLDHLLGRYLAATPVGPSAP